MMRTDMFKGTCLVVALMTGIPMLHAQNEIEGVIVETYYVSDANDATDTIGGGLVQGSKTYRIYLDLAPDHSLRAVYGRVGHPLFIQSTAVLFNHLDRGRLYGHTINNNALDEGVAALDSWLSLGAASNQRMGILKSADTDGSILGGNNNDGGSEGIPGGLLLNGDPLAGIPITQQDGLVPGPNPSVVPPSFLVSGEEPAQAFGDSSMVDSFNTEDFRMGSAAPGVKGVDAENRVLIAQVTTAGELSFELNVEVQQPDGIVVRFVARDTLLNANETVNGSLVYPPRCGCTDPDFLEYDQLAGCDDGSCQTGIVFGCLDPAACNFSTTANFNIAQLCCYGPDNCNGLDVGIVCPNVSVASLGDDTSGLVLFPNPVLDEVVHLRVTNGLRISRFMLQDITGRVVREGVVPPIEDARTAIALGSLAGGMYRFTFQTSRGPVSRSVIVP
jgi:hypothetical protein